MSIRWTVVLQLGALFLQTVVPTVPGFPASWTPFCHAMLAFIQAAQGVFAHFYNLDGTSATFRLKVKAGEDEKV